MASRPAGSTASDDPGRRSRRPCVQPDRPRAAAGGILPGLLACRAAREGPGLSWII